MTRTTPKNFASQHWQSNHTPLALKKCDRAVTAVGETAAAVKQQRRASEPRRVGRDYKYAFFLRCKCSCNAVMVRRSTDGRTGSRRLGRPAPDVGGVRVPEPLTRMVNFDCLKPFLERGGASSKLPSRQRLPGSPVPLALLLPPRRPRWRLRLVISADSPCRNRRPARHDRLEDSMGMSVGRRLSIAAAASGNGPMLAASLRSRPLAMSGPVTPVASRRRPGLEAH